MESKRSTWKITGPVSWWVRCFSSPGATYLKAMLFLKNHFAYKKDCSYYFSVLKAIPFRMPEELKAALLHHHRPSYANSFISYTIEKQMKQMKQTVYVLLLTYCWFLKILCLGELFSKWCTCNVGLSQMIHVIITSSFIMW